MEILSRDDIMTATFEFTLKNHSRTHRTLMCLLLLPYMVTPITKRTSPSKNHSRTHRTLMCLPLLPYMVTLITKRTSPLNSHQKSTPEHIEHLCVCHYCHIWSL